MSMESLLTELVTERTSTEFVQFPVLFRSKDQNGSESEFFWAANSALHTLFAGRDYACKLLLADPKVSRKHLEFSRHQNGLFARSLSPNPTFFDGVELTSRLIDSNCTITCGQSAIDVFVSGVSSSTPVVPINDGNSNYHTEYAQHTPQSASHLGAAYYARFIATDPSGNVLKVFDVPFNLKDEFLVGRDPSQNHQEIADKSISRRQFNFVWLRNEIHLINATSSVCNPTLVNDHKPTGPVKINKKSSIRAGKVTIRLTDLKIPSWLDRLFNR